MNKEAKLKKLVKVWRKADTNRQDCAEEVEIWIKEECYLSDYQNGYLDAKMEEIGNCMSSDTEDWLWEVESVMRNLLKD